MVYFGGFFAKLEFSRGFFYCKYHLYRWKDQRSCDSRGHYIVQPRWFSGRLHWGPDRDFLQDFFIILARRNSEAVMGGAGEGDRGGGHYFFRVPNSLEGCNGWGE